MAHWHTFSILITTNYPCPSPSLIPIQFMIFPKSSPFLSTLISYITPYLISLPLSLYIYIHTYITLFPFSLIICTYSHFSNLSLAISVLVFFFPSKMSGGGSRVLIPNNVRRMIQDIKEIAGKHSDDDIYAMLKDCNMDPNETAQKLLYIGRYHAQ